MYDCMYYCVTSVVELEGAELIRGIVLPAYLIYIHNSLLLEWTKSLVVMSLGADLYIFKTQIPTGFYYIKETEKFQKATSHEQFIEKAFTESILANSINLMRNLLLLLPTPNVMSY